MECPCLAGFAAPLAMTNGPGFCSAEEIKKGTEGDLKYVLLELLAERRFIGTLTFWIMFLIEMEGGHTRLRRCSVCHQNKSSTLTALLLLCCGRSHLPGFFEGVCLVLLSALSNAGNARTQVVYN